MLLGFVIFVLCCRLSLYVQTNSVAQETISSVRTVMSFARERAEVSRCVILARVHYVYIVYTTITSTPSHTVGSGASGCRYGDRVGVLYHLNMKQLFMQSVYYMVVATFLVNCCVQVGILLYGTHLVRAGRRLV